MPQNHHHKLKEIMGVQNAITEHYAPLSQKVILELLRDLEEKMDQFGEKLKVTRKAFNVVTETLQNIVRYSSPDADDEASFPTFILDRQEDKYKIGSGNLVRKEQVERIRAKLDYLNGLDWYGVQQAYKEVIKGNLKNDDPNRDKNSAGLGFIEMARKSEQKLEYQFLPYNSDNEYFILVVVINK